MCFMASPTFNQRGDCCLPKRMAPIPGVFGGERRGCLFRTIVRVVRSEELSAVEPEKRRRRLLHALTHALALAAAPPSLPRHPAPRQTLRRLSRRRRAGALHRLFLASAPSWLGGCTAGRSRLSRGRDACQHGGHACRRWRGRQGGGRGGVHVSGVRHPANPQKSNVSIGSLSPESGLFVLPVNDWTLTAGMKQPGHPRDFRTI